MITFDSRTKQFRRPNGQFIELSEVRKSVDKIVSSTERKFESIGKRYAEGKINLPQFQIEMKELIKSSHIASVSISKGGRKQMTASDWGKVGNDLKTQYRYLNRFARQIEQGTQSSAMIANRARSYGKAPRAAYFKGEAETRMLIGKVQCRRIISIGENCPDCLFWAAKGFVDIELMPPIGSLQCKNGCKCRLEYK